MIKTSFVILRLVGATLAVGIDSYRETRIGVGESRLLKDFWSKRLVAQTRNEIPGYTWGYDRKRFFNFEIGFV
jgi:hypothetical protein